MHRLKESNHLQTHVNIFAISWLFMKSTQTFGFENIRNKAAPCCVPFIHKLVRSTIHFPTLDNKISKLTHLKARGPLCVGYEPFSLADAVKDHFSSGIRRFIKTASHVSRAHKTKTGAERKWRRLMNSGPGRYVQFSCRRRVLSVRHRW